MQFIANKLYNTKSKDKRNASLPAITIATAGVALGIAIMLISIAIVVGFKREVGQKLTGFATSIEILNIHSLQLPEANPIIIPSYLQQRIQELDNVAHTQRVSQKMGVLKTNENFSAITLKGIDRDYDTTHLHSLLIDGRIPTPSADTASGEILISQQIAREHSLKVGDKVYAYFFEQNIKTRRFNIVGIYESHLKQFDSTFAITDRFTVGRLNNWIKEQFSELEIQLVPTAQIEPTQAQIQNLVKGFPNLSVINVREHYPQVFSWLEMLDLNTWVILILMLGVAIFTMTSGTLIIILEHTPTIGLLVALGASKKQLRKIFLILATRIMLKGIVIGNVVGITLLLILKYTDFITLDPETYYVKHIPISITFQHWLSINIATSFIILITLLVPTLAISRIQPSKSIKFD